NQALRYLTSNQKGRYLPLNLPLIQGILAPNP
ncbi:MAG: hypothetical protein RLZZ567_566, partial [Actinomycetota bacterium]